MKGDLAKIIDAETDDLVKRLTMGLKTWIGAHRIGPLILPYPRSDQWTWADGSPLDYSNWNEKEPDNWNGGDEFCSAINLNKAAIGRWSDANCDNTGMYSYVCQL